MAAALSAERARELLAQHITASLPAPSLRAFIAGSRVSYERFTTELELLFTEAGFEAYDDLTAVREYAGGTADPVWTDLDTGRWD